MFMTIIASASLAAMPAQSAQPPASPPAAARKADAAVPSGPAAQMLEALAKGETAVEAFIDRAFIASPYNDEPRERMVERLKALARQSGGVDISNWEPGGPGVFFSGTTRRGGLAVDGMAALDGDKLIHFEMRRDRRVRGADAPAWPPAATDAPGAVRAIEAEIDWRAGRELFSGAVLIAHRGKPVLERGWGLAERGPDVRNQADTLFTTASTTKMLTSTAIARLVDQGRLSLDTSIAKAVPEMADWPGAAGVTIRDLLGHRVDYGEYFDERARYPELVKNHRRVSELLPLLDRREPKRAPTGRVAYSNANYLVLGAAVEAVSGRSLYDYVAAEVLRPARMTRTTYGDPVVRPAHAAVPWVKDEAADPLALGDWQVGRVEGTRGGPAGGVWSTTRELWQFLDGVAAGRAMKPETLQAMLADRVQVGPKLGTALGFMYWGGKDVTFFGHAGGGGNAGISTAAFTTPDREWTVVVLSNFSSPSGEELATRIMGYLASLPREGRGQVASAD